MIHKVIAQLVLAFSMLHVIPVDAANLEWEAGIPVPEDARGVPFFSLGSRYSLPVADDRVLPPKKTDLDSFGIATSARSAIVIDVVSGQSLFEKGADEMRPIGSITKLMTALVFLETSPKLESTATILPEDFVGGGRVYLRFNDSVLLRDVLAASVIGSDNTATKALQRLSGLSSEEFIVRMNSKALELGMMSSSFTDPSGIDAGNVSTARDLYFLLTAAKGAAPLPSMMTSASVMVAQASGYAVNIDSTDELLGGFLNANPYRITGGKTGYIPQAGYCFITSLEKNGDEVFVAVLGAESILDRFSDAKGLAVWAFNTFTWPEEL